MRLTVTSILAGLIIGSGFAVYLFAQWLANRPAEMVTVLVARQAIPPWTILKEPEKLFMPVQVAKGTEPTNAVATFEQLKGQLLAHPLAEDQPVTGDDLRDQKYMDSLAILMEPPSGFRLVAVEFNPQQVAGERILPGARVDVQLVPRRGDKEIQTKTILKDIMILAVDDDRIATLMVPPEDEPELARAKDKGEIKLAARPTPSKDSPERSGQ